MSFKKVESIVVSERVFSIIINELDLLKEDITDGDLSGWLETFCNCREQGYVLYLDYFNKKETENGNQLKLAYVWVCQQRNSDDIMVVVSTDRPAPNNMFSDKDFSKGTKYFNYDEEHKAADYVINFIKETFNLE